jgi:hypothetical protein
MRVDVYVGERDLFGIGFSDNVVFRKQFYVQAAMQPRLKLYWYPDERFAEKGFQLSEANEMVSDESGWRFPVSGTGFEGALRIELDEIPPIGPPVPMKPPVT